jgi:signal transduction histidine kinase/CHASE3 domain sensor protein
MTAGAALGLCLYGATLLLSTQAKKRSSPLREICTFLPGLAALLSLVGWASGSFSEEDPLWIPPATCLSFLLASAALWPHLWTAPSPPSLPAKEAPASRSVILGLLGGALGAGALASLSIGFSTLLTGPSSKPLFENPVSTSLGLLLIAHQVLTQALRNSDRRFVLSPHVRAAAIATIVLILLGNTLSRRETVLVARSSEETKIFINTVMELHSLRNSIAEDQEGVRGFVLTGDPAFLTLSEKALAHQEQFLHRLQTAPTTAPLESSFLKELAKIRDEWLQIRLVEIRDRQMHGLDSAAESVRKGSGSAALTKLRLLILAQEKNAIAALENRGKNRGKLLSRTLALLPLSTLSVLCLLGILLHRFNELALNYNHSLQGLERDRSRLKLAMAAGNLAELSIEPLSGALQQSPDSDRIFGATLPPPENLTTLFTLVDPDDREKVRRAISKSVATGENWAFDCRIRRADNQPAWLWARGTCIKDASGGVSELLGVICDQTSLVRSELELRMNESRLRLATSAAYIGIWDWNVQTQAVHWDAEMFRIYGIPETSDHQVPYSVWADRVHPSDLNQQESELRAVIQNRDRSIREFRIIRASDGETRYIKASDQAILGRDGLTERVVGVNIDITDQARRIGEIRQLNEALRTRTEELESSVKELDAFTYSVSHDLRAPLRAIDGFSKILAEDYALSLDAAGRNVIKIICSETHRMGRLIDDLLAFSRLGRQKIEPTLVNMQSLARSVFEELIAQEPGRKITLELGPLSAAWGTEPMLRQVWVNLIGNAIKFSSERETALIQIRSGYDEGFLTYTVQDNGAGFDMRYADKLFQVFQRLHSSAQFPGTGVGLALVQRIITRHGGYVWAEAIPDKGASFSFSLPCPEASLSVLLNSTSPQPAEANSDPGTPLRSVAKLSPKGFACS